MNKSKISIINEYDGDCEMRPFYPEKVEKGKCGHCSLLDTYLYHNPQIKLKKKAKVMDIFACYDVGTIVSLRFKEISEKYGFDGLEFIPFDSEPGFFQLFSRNIAKVDIERSNLRFEYKCPVCHRYKYITQAWYELLNENEVKSRNTLFIIDIGLGSNSDKNRAFVANEEVVKILKNEKVKGFYTKNVGVLELESGSKPTFTDEADQNSFDRGEMDFEKFKKEQWDLDNHRIGIYSDFF